MRNTEDSEDRADTAHFCLFIRRSNSIHETMDDNES